MVARREDRAGDKTVAAVIPSRSAEEPTAFASVGPKIEDATTLPPEGVRSGAASSRVARRIGDYEVLAEIARGGMGIVCRARRQPVVAALLAAVVLVAAVGLAGIVWKYREAEAGQSIAQEERDHAREQEANAREQEALAEKRRGEAERARTQAERERTLDKAEEWIDREVRAQRKEAFTPGGLHPNEWLECRILLPEARALIGKPKR